MQNHVRAHTHTQSIAKHKCTQTTTRRHISCLISFWVSNLAKPYYLSYTHTQTYNTIKTGLKQSGTQYRGGGGRAGRQIKVLEH